MTVNVPGDDPTNPVSAFTDGFETIATVQASNGQITSERDLLFSWTGTLCVGHVSVMDRHSVDKFFPFYPFPSLLSAAHSSALR